MEDNYIKSVDPTSPLCGRVCVGDTIVSINGNEILDVLDYKFFAYDRVLDVTLQRPDGTQYALRVKKPEGGDLGLDFESYLMDAPRACSNACVFCFIDQLPRGMRKTMYFKDDDARLSFLLGNYITLTNLSPREVERIIALHVSPINVSVHTMNPELRCKMLRNPKAGESIDVMRRFAKAGIVMNCQIVCCPGLNDGEELLHTMRELEALWPAVHSVSIVPVGLTRFRERLYPLTPFTREHAGETLDLVGRELPGDEYYEEYTQLENGVGTLRLLETEFKSAVKLADEPDGIDFAVATGVSAAPYLEKLLQYAREAFPALKGHVYAIENDFFGRSINVTGLVTGGDLIRQLRGKKLGERLLISQNMLRRAELDFLDDVKIEEASAALGVSIYPVESDGFALCDAMFGLLPEIRVPERAETDEKFYRYNN